MFLYHQDLGILRDKHGQVIATGLYSGHGAHKNDHLSQNLAGEGPIPVGVYHIGEPFLSPQTGRYVLRLIPVQGDELFGRAAFEMHGENAAHVGESSDGCIIAPLDVRELVANSGDALLAVLPPFAALAALA